jgi:hypothetical protein
MPWYKDKRRQLHTETYNARTAAARDAQNAAKYGWRVDAEEESEAPFADRNWATGGPVGTFLSGMREPDEREIVVTYVRTEAWLAANQRT